MNIPCISFGQFIVSLIILIVVASVLSGVSAPVARFVGGVFPSLLFIWWLSGFFRECNDSSQYHSQYGHSQYIQQLYTY